MLWSLLYSRVAYKICSLRAMFSLELSVTSRYHASSGHKSSLGVRRRHPNLNAPTVANDRIFVEASLLHGMVFWLSRVFMPTIARCQPAQWVEFAARWHRAREVWSFPDTQRARRRYSAIATEIRKDPRFHILDSRWVNSRGKVNGFLRATTLRASEQSDDERP